MNPPRCRLHQSAIDAQQLCIQIHRKGQIARVVRGQVMPVLPYLRQQMRVRMPLKRHIDEFVEGAQSACRRHLTPRNPSTQGRGDLDVDEVRSMNIFIVQLKGQIKAHVGMLEDLKDCRSVNHDHLFTANRPESLQR